MPRFALASSPATGVLRLPLRLPLLVLLLLVLLAAHEAHALSSPSNTNTNVPRVAVLGATGRLGSETVLQLLQQQIPVSVLVRSSSVDKLDPIIRNHPGVTVFEGDLLAPLSSDTSKSKSCYTDATSLPSDQLVRCLEGCSVCISCYGATRKTKPTDWLGSALLSDANAFVDRAEDTDPIHAKQLNYRATLALVKACQAQNENNDATATPVKHVIRITGKGEDPTSIFSVLLNGLGSFCKLWNYQGEVALRNSGLSYTIFRPGVMVDELKPLKDNDKNKNKIRYLKLAGNGGNDLAVSPVTRGQIAELLVALATDDANENRRKVTLAAMNVVEEEAAAAAATATADNDTTSISSQIAALSNDSRDFPASLEAEHKSAVRAFVRKIVGVLVGGLALAVAALLAGSVLGQ